MNKILFLCLITLTISSLDLESFRNEVLEIHNTLRAKHQVGPLSRYSELESLAQKHSEYMAKMGKMVHSDNKLNNEYIGENICSGSSTLKIGKSCVNLWYSEEDQYDYKNPNNDVSCGHFTQLVWKKTNRLGCGVECTSSNYCYVTCNYYPAGNYYNQFMDNVFPNPNKEKEAEEAEEDDTPESSQVTDQQLEKFRNEALARHNYYRAQHNAGDLVRSAKLEKIAQDAAEYMVETNKWYFPEETYNDDYIGSSLFWYNSVFDGNSITDTWYDEQEFYNFSKPGYVENAGGFTQLVWKSSKKMGCGYACKGLECYGICTYYPSGNYQNEFEKNVFPKTS